MEVCVLSHQMVDSPNCKSDQYGGNEPLVGDLRSLNALVCIIYTYIKDSLWGFC